MFNRERHLPVHSQRTDHGFFPSRFVPLAALVIGSVASADEPAPLVKPLLTQPGKLLFRADLDKPFSESWRHAKGSWQVVEGAMQGEELPADMHMARPDTL